MDIIPEIQFSGEIWYWRGPAPFYFVTLPKEESAELIAICKHVTYGWGMIIVSAKTENCDWKTSLFRKDDRYVLPLKKSVREEEHLKEGDSIDVALRVL